MLSTRLLLYNNNIIFITYRIQLYIVISFGHDDRFIDYSAGEKNNIIMLIILLFLLYIMK